MPVKRFVAALLLGGGLWLPAGQALAQDGESGEGAEVGRLAAEIAACRMVRDPTERLRCYDAAAGLADEESVVEQGVVMQLAGEDDFDSDLFVSETPWHLRWNSRGSIFTVELQDITGELIAIIGNQIGAGENRSEVQPPGEYRVAVRAIGSWQIWVMEED